MSESASRATLYVMAISSALVGLGYIGQVSEVGDVFGGAAVALALGVAVDASLGLAAGVGGAWRSPRCCSCATEIRDTIGRI